MREISNGVEEKLRGRKFLPLTRAYMRMSKRQDSDCAEKKVFVHEIMSRVTELFSAVL